MLKRFASVLFTLITIAVVAQDENERPKLQRVETLKPVAMQGSQALVNVSSMQRSMKQMMDYLSSISGVNILSASETLEVELRKELVNVPQLENVNWQAVLELLCKQNGLRIDDKRIKEKIVVVWRPKVVTLNFKEASLRDVIWSIAQQAELNVVIDPEVQGTVNASMKNVAWDVALSTILRANGYEMVNDNGNLRIAR